MNRLEVFSKELLEDCAGKVHLARQVCSKDAGRLKELGEYLKEQMEKLPDDCRIVVVNLEEYHDFAGLVKGILMKIFDDPKFKPDDVLAEKELIAKIKSESELCYQLHTLLKEDFEELGIYLLLVMEHYEAAPNYCNATNFGWLRGLSCDVHGLSMLLLSDRSADKVSDEPVGSSPFYNIFDDALEVFNEWYTFFKI